MLGPLLFLLYIDDLHSVVKHLKLKLCADDVTLYIEIKCESDCQLLQEILDHIYDWAKKWQLHLNASKCEAFPISNKHKVIFFDYIVNSSPLFWSSIWGSCSIQICHDLSSVSLFQPKLASH